MSIFAMPPGQNKLKILIVEDEPKTGRYLQQGLTESGFVVNLANDGADGCQQALSETYNLIVLDVLLPTMDGWSVLQSIRDAGVTTPVLFLTAKDQIADRVKGFELGADDYLIKPFAFAELLARIRNILRRAPFQTQPTRLTIADLELDLLRRQVHRSGTRVMVTPKEFALLELLIRHEGEVLSRALIASQVWDMNFNSDTNVIDVAVKRLRAKVDTGYQLKLIHTVRGMGYVITTEPE